MPWSERAIKGNDDHDSLQLCTRADGLWGCHYEKTANQNVAYEWRGAAYSFILLKLRMRWQGLRQLICVAELIIAQERLMRGIGLPSLMTSFVRNLTGPST